MFDVWRHQEWAVEEHLLALSLGDLVQVPVLVGVAGVPLKTGALSQVVGKAGHLHVYAEYIRVSSAGRCSTQRPQSRHLDFFALRPPPLQIGRASCRERV